MAGLIARYVLFLAIILAFQWRTNAWNSEASDDRDEPAHIVTGLMVNDYLLSALGRSPLKFAQDYYDHYPRVAIGHWPPVFYIEQALWMLVFPTSRNSILIMIAAQLAGIATILWSILRNHYGLVIAWCGAFVILTMPGVVAQSSAVMTEIPMALLILLAVLCWSRYLDSPSCPRAVLFGACAALAILSKPTAVVLAVMPLVSVWLTGRKHLFKAASFWMPLPVVIALCAPWYLLAPGAAQERVFAYPQTGLLSRPRIPAEPWASQFGWIGTVGAIAGFVILARGRKWSSMQASAAGVAIMASLAPMVVKPWHGRHLVETAPSFLILACAIPSPGLLVAGSALAISGSLLHVPRQANSGYLELTNQIRTSEAHTVLISGNATAEGLLILQLAQAEPHPSRRVIRASKLFAEIDWMGRGPMLKVRDATDTKARMLAAKPDLVIVDNVNRSPLPYQSWLLQALPPQQVSSPNPRFTVAKLP